MAARNASAPSTAAVVRDYIDTHPSIKDGMRMGIINLSALARRICDEKGLKSEEAALMACRRYEVDPRQRGNEEAILKVMRRSKLEIRTKVVTMTVRPSFKMYGRLEKTMGTMRGRDHPLQLIQGTGSVTLIMDGAVHQELAAIFAEEDIIKTETDLVELIVNSPEVIEDVPGIVSFLASSLSSKGINFLETISCWRDTMFVIEKKDMMPAFETLNAIVEG